IRDVLYLWLKFNLVPADSRRRWRRLRLATFLSVLSAVIVANRDLRKPFDSSADPAEAALFIRVRIEHPGYLPRRSKEILVYEGIVVGQEDPESGMRVIPANNPLVGILLVLDLINMLPSVLRECDMGAGFLSISSWNAGLNSNFPGPVLPNQNAANFGTWR